MSGSTRTSHRVEYLPGASRWAALGVLCVFVVIGTVQHAQHNTLLLVLGVVLAIGASVLSLETPGWALVACAAVAAAGVALLCDGSPSNVGWFAVCLLAGWCVLAGGWRVGVAYWVGAVAMFGGEALWADPDPGWGAWIVGTTFTALGCMLIRHEYDLVTKLREAQAGLAERATVEERNRIARELHDVIAHTLIVSQLHVTSARLSVENDPADAARALAEAERLGRESLAEVRRAVGLLRDDSGNGAVAPLPGAGELPALVERYRSAGADVTLAVDGDASALPSTTGLAVYRILQEALTNAAKHARSATVNVDLTITPDRVELVVDSAGSPGRGDGLGLLSMRERAAALGGTCEAGPGGHGWLVRAEFPLDEHRHAGRAT